MSDVRYILNENNIYMDNQYIKNLLKEYDVELDHEIKNLSNFHIAMVHISYLIRNENFYKNNKSKLYQIQLENIPPLDEKLIPHVIPLQEQSYEIFEFGGDSILHHIIASYLIKRYGYLHNEGILTTLRIKIENSKSFSKLATVIGLNKYLIISKYVEYNNGRINTTILEDAFEAFIYALELEIGFANTNKFIVNLIEREFDFANLNLIDDNYKSLLLHYCHKMGWNPPTYGKHSQQGPENNKIFNVYVKIHVNKYDDGKIIATGTGSSITSAEQNSSYNALIAYKEIRSDVEDTFDVEKI